MLKKIALCLCFTLFLGLVSACTPKGMLHPNTSESPNQNQPKTPENGKNAGNTNPSEPSGSAADSGTTDAKEISAPVAIPPSFGTTDPYAKTGDQGAALSSQSGIPGLQPMKGVNVDTLFAEKLKDSDERFERLEDTVLEMRKEMNNVMPSIVRLIAIESDIQNLTQELEGMLQETPPADSYLPTNLTSDSSNEAELEVSQLNPQPQYPDDEAPAVSTTAPSPVPSLQTTPPIPPPEAADTKPPVPHATQQEEPPAAKKPVPPPTPAKAASKEKTASSLRLGEYNDKVRVVIDTSKKPNVTAEYDSEEHLIVLEVMDAKWIGDTEKTFSSSKLVQSYSVSPRADGQGVTIAVVLKKGTKILKQGTVDPDENPNYRFYLDLSL